MDLQIEINKCPDACSPKSVRLCSNVNQALGSRITRYAESMPWSQAPQNVPLDFQHAYLCLKATPKFCTKDWLYIMCKVVDHALRPCAAVS